MNSLLYIHRLRGHILRHQLRMYSKGHKEVTKCAELSAKDKCAEVSAKDKCAEKKDSSSESSREKEKKSPPEKCDMKKVTLIEGDGVGPELMKSLRIVFEAAKVPVEFEQINEIRTPGTSKVSKEVLESLKKNGVGIKGPLKDNFLYKDLRRKFDVYAYAAVCRNMEGQDNPYGTLNCVVIRDLLEGEYSGIEHTVVPGVLQSIKVTTAAGAKRIAKYVFQYAKDFDRKKITVAHKANISRMTDGMFLKQMRLEATKHIQERLFEERYMDTACLNLILNPESNDILVSSSMYGDVLLMMASSITGSKAMCPGYGVSPHGLLFDTLNTHNEKIAGQDKINPTGMLFSGVLLLRRLKLVEEALSISCAIKAVYKETDLRTGDIGGTATCSEFTKAVCDFIAQQ